MVHLGDYYHDYGSMSCKRKNYYSRNVHKSAINALILSGNVIFMKPHMDVELGIANGINIAELKETIEEHPDAKEVFVINPTYFGVTSNLKEIVKIAHEHQMLVLCDEAHGAHLDFQIYYRYLRWKQELIWRMFHP